MKNENFANFFSISYQLIFLFMCLQQKLFQKIKEGSR